MTEIQPDTSLPKTKKIRVYTALMTQGGTAPPSAEILQNTLGETVIWTYIGVGLYHATISTNWDITKTTATIQKNLYNKGFNINVQAAAIPVSTLTNQNAGENGILNKTLVEIKIYDI